MDRRDFLQQTLIATVTVPVLLETSSAAVVAEDGQIAGTTVSDRPVDPFELRLGHGLLPPLVDYRIETVLNEIRQLRERLRCDATPVEMPLLRLRDDVHLEEHTLLVLLQGQPLFSRYLPPSFRTGEKVAHAILSSVELAARRHFRAVNRQERPSFNTLLTAEEIEALMNFANQLRATE